MVPLVQVLTDEICPIQWLRRMLSMCPGQPDGPAFMILDKQSRLKPLTYRTYTKYLKYWVEKVGLEPKRFTSHCARCGGATWAFEINLPGQAIRLLGDWASEAYLNYINITLEARLKAMNVFANAMNEL